MRPIAKYIEILKKKGLRYSIQEGWRALWPLWFTTDREVKDLIHQRRAICYLERRYKFCFRDYPLPDKEARVPKQIWICWLQGLENAPVLVQKCVESVRKQCPDFNVTVLTEETMFEYVTLPVEVVKKYNSGRLPFTQFSDILRVALLSQHGGIWMDATVFMSGEMPREVTEGSLFMFRAGWLSPSLHVGSSWMLASVAHHPVMVNLFEALCEYWRQESFLRDYYLVHDLLAVAYRTHEQSKQLIDAMPYVNNLDPHTLMYRAAQQPFSEALKQDIFSRSHIHKLSYKNAVDYSMYLQ